MVAWHCAERPALSVAVNVTICTPLGNNVPGGGFCEIAGQQQLSTVLISAVMSGKAARYSPGVKDFLTFGARIAEVGEDIIQALRERCPGGIAQIDSISAKPGDTVRINEGPFSGLEAIFEQFLKGSERVAVLLEILGRQTRLVLPSETIAATAA